jgi:hypothetical protein
MHRDVILDVGIDRGGGVETRACVVDAGVLGLIGVCRDGRIATEASVFDAAVHGHLGISGDGRITLSHPPRPPPRSQDEFVSRIDRSRSPASGVNLHRWVPLQQLGSKKRLVLAYFASNSQFGMVHDSVDRYRGIQGDLR